MNTLFERLYGHEAQAVYFAPGRVNLIGEHTDYNGGFVFPCAINFGTRLTIAPNQDRCLRFRSVNMEPVVELPIDQCFAPLPDRCWVNYPLGCIAQLATLAGGLPMGYDMLFEGNVPLGAGLSSSASIEVVTAYAFSCLLGKNLSLIEIAKVAQHSEHSFAGVQCGIMDQFVAANGRQDHALFLNCDTLEFMQVPIRLDGVAIVITNSHSPHRLDSGTYNERVRACQKAVECIRKEKEIEYLAQLSPEDFARVQHTLTDAELLRRARHVVSETQRTREAVQALQQGDLNTFGLLMNASHRSLRDDYEVTGVELDTLAEAAWQTAGVLGSRMTGGGFGGCTVSLVREDAIEAFKKQVSRVYTEKTGLTAEFYIARTSDGVHIVRNAN